MARKATPKRVKVTWVRSTIGCPQDQKDTVRALGLKRLHHTIEKDDTPTVRGMLFKVKHLIEVSDI